MIVIGEGQILNVIIHAVAQVITYARRDPLRPIAVTQIQERGAQSKSQEKERRADEVELLTARQSIVNHGADNARHHEAESGEDQQHQECQQDLPKIWLEEDSYSK